MELDKDLRSIQEVRALVAAAKAAQLKLREFSQEQINRIVAAMSEAGYKNAQHLGQAAQRETGFGRAEHKKIKNEFASATVYKAIKDMKTVGILREYPEEKLVDLGVGVGVIAGIVPSTNPTSTVIYKSLISLKAGNTIVFSPHPSAVNCTLEAVALLNRAAAGAGCPEGAIGCISTPTQEAVSALMKHRDIRLILATGGGAMVKAAYSSGTPAIGVGAGNGPAFIDKTADLPLAVKRILDSKTFDNGTICASEQSIIVEKAMEAPVLEELKRQGAYLLDEEEATRLGRFILRENGTMNPQIVGREVSVITKLAGLTNVPKDARVLVARETGVGKGHPYSNEKLGLVLAFYVEDSREQVLKRSIEILEYEGSGHTFCIHAKDDELVRNFAQRIPASRILINTPAALGGIGATTNLFPALTLGCGAVGGSSSSNNIGPLDLINIKRIAYGVRDIEELYGENKNATAVTFDETAVNELVALLLKKLI